MTAPLDPHRAAMLVMDYQVGILGRAPEPELLVDRTVGLVDAARTAGLTIGHVRVGFTDADFERVPSHSSFAAIASDPALRETMHADAPSTQPHPLLTPVDGDIAVRKTRVGPFTSTDLQEQLAQRGIDTLVLAGISTSGVVLSTVRQSMDLDFRILVVSDACADPDTEVHDVLMTKVFPRHAEVLTAAELAQTR